MENVIVCGIQISVYPLDIKKNIEKICEWYLKAIKETDAKLIVFPESITTGFAPNMNFSDFYNLLPDNIDNLLEPVKKISREKKRYCVLPSYEKIKNKNVIYNSAFLIDKDGNIAGVYRKTHLFPTERKSAGGWSTPGNEYPVFETEFGKIGIMICYDGDFPEVARILSIKGAEIIVRPSALLRSFDIWELTNKARAYDNHVYILAVNGVGPDAANNYYFGHSMIVSPIAQIIALARGTEEIVYAELDKDPIKYITYGTDSPMCFDHLEDRNCKSYKDYLTKEAKSSFEPFERIKYLEKELQDEE